MSGMVVPTDDAPWQRRDRAKEAAEAAAARQAPVAPAPAASKYVTQAQLRKNGDAICNAIAMVLKERAEVANANLADIEKSIAALHARIDHLDVAKPDALYRSATAKRLAATKHSLIAYAVDFQNHRAAIIDGKAAASPILQKALGAK